VSVTSYKYSRTVLCGPVGREVPPRIYNLLNEGGSEEKWWEVRTTKSCRMFCPVYVIPFIVDF
jgi:hypothetical protein